MNNRTASPLAAQEWFLVGACLTTVFAAHAAFGALTATASLFMVIAWAAVVFAGLSIARVRSQFAVAPGLLSPALLMACVFGAAFLSLWPVGTLETKAAWVQLGLRPAATLDTSATTIEVVKLVGLCCAILAGVQIGCDDDRARAVLSGLFYLGALFAGAAIAIFVFGLAPQSQHNRIEALFGNPNTAGTLFAMLLVLGAAPNLRNLERSLSHRQWGILVLPPACWAVLAVALVMTASRGASIAALLGLTALGAVEANDNPTRRRAVALAAGVMLVAGVGLLAVQSQLLGRFGVLSADSALRARIASTHWQLFLSSPVLGYGLGTFDTLNQAHMTPDTFASLWNIRSAENVYLQWVEEAGIAGALPMFACIATVIVSTLKSGVERTRMRSWIFGLIAVDIVVLAHGYTDFALQTPSIAAFWSFLLGLQLGLSSSRARR